MIITKIECIPLRYEMDEKDYRYNAISKLTARAHIIVKVHTDEGIVGIGESFSGANPAASTITVIEKELAPLVVGEDPLRNEWLWRRMYENTILHGRGGILPCAISGIDTALWDIKGKYLAQPVYKLLGGYSNRVEGYASGGFLRKGAPLDESGKELKELCDAHGYRAAKMKVGRNRTSGNPMFLRKEPEYHLRFEDDLERVRLARMILGPDIKLMVDANCAWDLHHALRAGRFFDEQNVYLFEEPVATDNWNASKILTRDLVLKIAGYETEQLAINFAGLITEQVVDVVQPDIAWVGGITEAKKIADIAAAFFKECATHLFGSAVLQAAALHLSCAIPNSGPLEMDTNPNPLRTELVKNPIRVDPDGFVTVSDRPGLGVELIDEMVEQYRLR